MRNIAITLPYLKRRGTEKQAFRIATQLKKRGYNPVIFNIQGWGEFETTFKKAGIQVVHIGAPEHSGERLVNTKRAGALAKSIQEWDCQAILSRANMGHQITLLANQKIRNPLPVILVLSGSVPVLKGSPYQKLKKIVKYYRKFGKATKIVTVSEEGKEDLQEYFPLSKKKISCIPNGVNVDEIKKLSKKKPPTEYKTDSFHISFVGSIDIKRKGIDILLKAFQKIVFLERQPKVKLHVIGSGDDEESLHEMIQDLNISQYVHFHGELKNPYSAVKNSDLFILSSRKEGMPNTLLEAMVLGVCCIATACKTGPSEIIDSYENGILVPSENIDKLFNVIKEVLSKPLLRKKMGHNAIETVKDYYTIERMGKDYVQLLNLTIKDAK
ncbi:MAG: glycosyltransferase [Balneolaceae bacterium]